MNFKQLFGFELLKEPVIINNIPRYIENNAYASAFGYQWKMYPKTQLDSYTGYPISKNRLTRIVGGSLDIFKDRTVLEAGCGAGSFTEILLRAGAKVCAVDISSAVEVNYNNFLQYPNYYIMQADIINLPIPENSFDFVLCVGVIQHTPDPEETIKRLSAYVKPNGILFIDHYSMEYPYTPIRKIFRNFLLKVNNDTALLFIQKFTYMFWWIHKLFYKYKHISWISNLRYKFIYRSPIVDFQDAYSFLGDKILYDWVILATFDTLTDYYKHLRTPEEIKHYLENSGMKNIQITLAGNGIEASATK